MPALDEARKQNNISLSALIIAVIGGKLKILTFYNLSEILWKLAHSGKYFPYALI